MFLKKKFIHNTLSGLLGCKSCHLTKIARKMGTKIILKKTVDKLSFHFSEFNKSDQLKTNYTNFIKSNNIISDDPLYIVDDCDISKPLSSKLEYLDSVLDGSNEHKATLGYWLTEIITLNKNNNPISLESRLWSTKEENFKSKNAILEEVINNNIINYGTEVLILHLL